MKKRTQKKMNIRIFGGSWLGILICLIFIGFSQLSFGLVRPSSSDGPERTADPFSPYQWVLFPKGQSLVLAVDFLHSEEAHISESSNIHWQDFDSRMKRDVVVAVMDSGVEVSHPDLREGLLPGISFVEKIEGDPNSILDDVGHGTHMASIMAARGGNQIGMRGFSNRIKVLPIKVYDDKDGRPDGRDFGCGKRRPPIGRRIIAALDYAIQKKVDVINFSMGWPRVANGPQVVAAFERARKAGILIVAAAGNDHHDGPIYPCSFAGVVCVGSVDIDGKLSAFSDFGGQVDLLAPGQEILGAWPTGYHIPSLNFQVRGYEVSSGTSQAASLVSSAAAVLRGLFPQEDSGEIRRRLLGSANHSVKHQPKVNAGLLDVRRAAQPISYDYVAADFKGVEVALVDAKDGRFRISLSVEGRVSGRVRVEPLSPKVTFGPVELSANGIELQGRVQDLNVENQVAFRLNLNGRDFYHRVALALDAFEVAAEKVKSSWLADVDDRVMSNSRSDKIELWGTESEGDGLTLKVWRKQHEKQNQFKIHFANVTKPLAGFGLIRQDWFFNGKESYLFAALKAKERNCSDENREGASRIADGAAKESLSTNSDVVDVWFYYLDDQFRLIERFKLSSTLNFVPILNSNPRNVIVGRVQLSDGRFLGVPVFFSNSSLNPADLNPDPFAFEKNEVGEHWFYLNVKDSVSVKDPGVNAKDPGGDREFEARALDAWGLNQFLGEQLNLPSNERAEVIGLQTQSREDLASGRVRLLMDVGQGGRIGRYVIESELLNRPWQKEKMFRVETPGVSLTNALIRTVWQIEDRQLNWATEYQQAYGFNSARSLTVSANPKNGIDEKRNLLETLLKLDRLDEKILGVVQTFRAGSNQVSFIQTSEYLRVMGSWGGRKVDGLTPYYRSRILPGEPFAQLMMPVLVGDDLQPGVVSDYTLILSPRLATYLVNEKGQVSSPLRLSFYVPEECSMDDSQLWSAVGHSQIGLHCRDGVSSHNEARSNGQYLILDIK